MSKIGQKPVLVPSTVAVEITGNTVAVKGKEGTLSVTFPELLKIAKENDSIIVSRINESSPAKALHGLFRTLLSNAVVGVEKPWEKKLEVAGTGFNVKMQGEDLFFKIGYSHPVIFKKVPGISYVVVGTNKVTVKGVDKQLVGEIAYKIKMLRKPDVYKGKGIKYEGEKLRIKPGKKAKTATA